MQKDPPIPWTDIYDLSEITDQSTVSVIENSLDKIADTSFGQSLFALCKQKMDLTETSNKISMLSSGSFNSARLGDQRIQLNTNSSNSFLSGTSTDNLEVVAFSLERSIVHETAHLLVESTDVVISNLERGVFTSILRNEIPNTLEKAEGISANLDAKLVKASELSSRAGISLHMIPHDLRGGTPMSDIKELVQLEIALTMRELKSILADIPLGDVRDELRHQLQRIDGEDFDLLIDKSRHAFLMNEDFATDLANLYEQAVHPEHPVRQHYQSTPRLGSVDVNKVALLNQVHMDSFDSFENDLEHIKGVLKGLDIAIPELDSPEMLLGTAPPDISSFFDDEGKYLGIKNVTPNGISENEKEFVEGIANLLLDLKQSEITVSEIQDSKVSYQLKYKDKSGIEKELALN